MDIIECYGLYESFSEYFKIFRISSENRDQFISITYYLINPFSL